MLDRSERLAKIATAGEVVAGPMIAALLLVPAAVILALYPLSWILGTVSFYTASMPIEPFRAILVVPILLGFALVQRRKDWLLAAMLVPGIILMLFAPDRIGSHQPNRSDAKAFYPEHYAPAAAAARISDIERSIGDASWLLKLSMPDFPQLEKIRPLQNGADRSVAAWRDRTSTDQQKAVFQQQLNQANARKAALGPQPPGSITNFGNIIQWQSRMATVTAEINTLTGQINKLSVGAAAGDLYPAAVSATAALKVELESLERLVAENISFAKALPYIVAASISFAVFMFAVGFMNWAMAGLVIMTALACLWSAWPVSLDDRAIELLLILYPAFICAASAFVLRFAYRGCLDNLQLAKEFDRSHLTRAAVRATLFWLPFPAVVLGAVLLNNWLYDAASSAIYCEGSTKAFCGSLASDPPIQDSDPSRDTLRDDVNAAIQRLLARFEAEAIRSAEGARSNVAAQVEAAKTQVMTAFVRMLPDNLYQIFPDLEPPSSCRWLLPDVKCFARKIALERLNAAYQAPRNRLKSRLENALADLGNKVTTGVVNTADGFQNAIKGESQAVALYATKTVDATFVGFNVFGVSQMALMLAVSIRAFLLIFGRMLYRGDPQTSKSKRDAAAEFAGLELTHLESNSPASGRITLRAYRDEYELVGDKFLPLLTKRLPNIDDADQATLLLRARYTAWPVRRFANGCLVLTKVTREQGKKSIRFSTVGGRQFVVWTLPAGTEVFFRWDRFVAMTAGMKIRKTISLRIGGLATGTTMHASVVGPGLLIQESRGQVELTQDEVTPGSVFPGRLMSWESGSRFRIKSPKQAASIYVDPPSLNIEPGARAVSDSGGDRRRGFGVLTELMRLFRP